MIYYDYYTLVLDLTRENPIIYYEEAELDYNEYFHTILNHLGNNGWELVVMEGLQASKKENLAIVPIYADTVVSSTDTAYVTYIFKKEKPEHSEYDDSASPQLKRLLEIEKTTRKN